MNKELNIAFKVGGGIGDILIAANYIEQFYIKYSKLNKISISIYTDVFFDVTVDIFFNKKYIHGVYLMNKTIICDMLIELIRFPSLILYNSKITMIKEFYEYISLLKKFAENYPYLLSTGTIFDYIGVRYSLLLGKNRRNQADIEEHLDIKDIFQLEYNSINNKILDKYNLGGIKFITIQRGVGESDGNQNVSTRSWPIEYYNSLVKLIKNKFNEYIIIQVGDKNMLKINGIDIDLRGKTSFMELESLLNNAYFHIDGECGMVHIRHFLNRKPSLVLFTTNSVEFCGYPENINLKSDVCSWCEWITPDYREKCAKGYQKPLCMYELKPEYVFSSIYGFLENGLSEDKYKASI